MAFNLGIGLMIGAAGKTPVYPAIYWSDGGFPILWTDGNYLTWGG